MKLHLTWHSTCKYKFDRIKSKIKKTHIQLQLELVDLIRGRVQFFQFHLESYKELQTIARDHRLVLPDVRQQQTTCRDGKLSRHYFGQLFFNESSLRACRHGITAHGHLQPTVNRTGVLSIVVYRCVIHHECGTVCISKST